jgi:hypothetical protein
MMRIRDFVTPESGIQDGKNSDPGSEINIPFPDPQHFLNPGVKWIRKDSKRSRNRAGHD